MKKYAAEHSVDLRPLELDVSSQESCNAAIQEIIGKTGRLDVVIHNAGHMVFGPAEAFTPKQLAELYDVNVLSTQRVNRAAPPQLRKQMRGLVVWVSSSSCAGGTPLGGLMVPQFQDLVEWRVSVIVNDAHAVNQKRGAARRQTAFEYAIAMAWRTWPRDFFSAAAAWTRETPAASITTATGVRLLEAASARRAVSWSAPVAHSRIPTTRWISFSFLGDTLTIRLP
jgi:NAD(P)-dependent dehydrogenase (short-subunit alcohol dehydrogenase family)